MSNQFLSQTDFAKYLGVTRAAVSEQVKKGNIPVTESRKIDISDPVVQEYANSPAATARRERAKVRKAGYEPITKPKKINGNGNGNLSEYTAADLQKLETIGKIEERNIKTAQKRNELVSRELVKKFFSQLYVIDQNEFKTLAASIIPGICSIAGIDDPKITLALEKLVAKEIVKILKRIQGVIDKLLKEMQHG